MYDQIKGRCVAVDLDSIVVKSNDISLKVYVQDYSELMLDVYLGNPPLNTLEKLLLKGELRQYMPEGWEEFNIKAEGYKMKYPYRETYGVGLYDLLRVFPINLF